MPRLLPIVLTLACAAVPAHAATTCSIGPAGSTQRMPVGDTGRAMTVHLPVGFDSAKRAPLVLLLHGSGSTGAAMLRDSKLADAADRHGFIVAAPDAGIPHDKGFVWNIPGVPTVSGRVPGPGDVDDVAYMARAIDWFVAHGCA
ncbi:MAG TPA: hypothetical protein VFO80_12345, partial [Sphingomonas sp.]|nr:hypothetical protein [Sphingomonas sp.]